MSEEVAVRRVWNEPGADEEPGWVTSYFQKRGAEEEARRSEERIARLAEQLAAQFTGK